MPAPILQTKLYRPNLRPDLVARSHLVQKLDRSVQAGARLILVSAPPGFGKTTLLVDWLTQSRHPAAWVSLDAHDNDPVQFFSYLVHALQAVLPDVGQDLPSSLASHQPSSFEPLLALLVNKLCRLAQNTFLVLDDYHAIDAPTVHTALTFLIDHLPPPMHIVIATRVDPPLPLARYRSRNEVVELRTDELRFTSQESALFLNQVMGLQLTTQEIAVLEARTEGWAVGLQMAALSLRHRPDATQFIQAFSGSNRYVLDYLIEEVLGHLPEEVQSFLLRTSILDRLTAPLCDAVSERTDSQTRLEQFDRDNLFIVSLDQERRWYRYHHLFRDLLLARLQQLHVKEIPTLHTRASEWFEQNGLVPDAVGHALAAKDYERSTRLLEQSGGGLLGEGLSLSIFVTWIQSIPREELCRHPLLCLRLAFALILTGHLEPVEALIDAAEQQIQNEPESKGALVRDEKTWSAYVRSYYASFRGESEAALQHARRALAFVRAEDEGMRSAVLTQLGELHAVLGQLDEASRNLSQAIPLQVHLGRMHPATNSYCRLAEIAKIQGRLNLAADLYRQNFALIAEQGDRPSGSVGMVEAGMGDMLRERNQLGEAKELLLKAIEHTRVLGRPYEQAVASHLLTHLWLSEGNLAAAQQVVREGDALAQAYAAMQPVRKRIDLGKVRLWLAAGNVSLAANWAREQRLDRAQLDYPHELDYMLYARILLAQGQLEQASGLIGQLAEAAQSGGRTGRLIEILVLQAIAFSRQGKEIDALTVLGSALSLAESEGYMRLFLDEGDAMRAMLRRISSESTNALWKRYAARLLAGMGETIAVFPARATANLHLPEALTPRELEVLRLVGQGLSNREIADRLVLSLPTVKKHVENIRGKLGVKSRSQAILHAQELKLL